tara:strand:+ start:258 stop:926 length:669 start_codon:yes stop_codon:yes gene_type:complete
MVTQYIARQTSKRAGQALRGTRDSATRRNEKGEKVRMAKDSGAGVMREVASPKARKAGAKKQGSPAAKAKRKAEAKQAADLKQPAAGSVGKGAEQADAGIPEYKVAAKKASDFDKALARKEKELDKIMKKADSIKDRMNKIKYVAENRTKIAALKASIKDMKSRGGPGGKTKIKYKKKKGGMVNRKGGGKVYKYSNGGGLGKTKGKKVSGNDGNAIVAACYD